MYKHLYDIFKHWYHGGTIYFYSDPHFGDLDCYKLRFPDAFKKDNINRVIYEKVMGKEKASTWEMDCVHQLDQMQIDNINRMCHKCDTLVILGDVGDIECVKKLKAGYKVLIMGNHDKGASNYKREIKYVPFIYGQKKVNDWDHITEIDLRTFEEVDNRLFDEVYEGTLQISPKIILSHEPIEYPYCLNIHGHDHNVNPLGAYTEGIGCTSHYNCCSEQIGYKPININSFFDNGLGIMKHIKDVHRVTIDKATTRKKKQLTKNT